MSTIESAPRKLAVTSDGSVALPPEMLDELGWREGDRLSVAKRSNGDVVLTPAATVNDDEQLSPAERVERFRQSAGKFFEGIDPVAYQRALRDEWQDPRARREQSESLGEPSKDA
jgi:bifunctional DNA-binding transcriptional regulator/antitoxin component of YhaV-PrlF toxin-antitoxin module